MEIETYRRRRGEELERDPHGEVLGEVLDEGRRRRLDEPGWHS